jgi:hypothetical protein
MQIHPIAKIIDDEIKNTAKSTFNLREVYYKLSLKAEDEQKDKKYKEDEKYKNAIEKLKKKENKKKFTERFFSQTLKSCFERDAHRQVLIEYKLINKQNGNDLVSELSNFILNSKNYFGMELKIEDGQIVPVKNEAFEPPIYEPAIIKYGPIALLTVKSSEAIEKESGNYWRTLVHIIFASIFDIDTEIFMFQTLHIRNEIEEFMAKYINAECHEASALFN